MRGLCLPALRRERRSLPELPEAWCQVHYRPWGADGWEPVTGIERVPSGAASLNSWADEAMSGLKCWRAGGELRMQGWDHRPNPIGPPPPRGALVWRWQ